MFSPLRSSTTYLSASSSLSIFAVRRYGKSQLASENPQRIILRLVQVSSYREKRIAHLDRDELRDGASRLFLHFANVRTWQHGNKLEPLGIGTIIVAAPI